MSFIGAMRQARSPSSRLDRNASRLPLGLLLLGGCGQPDCEAGYTLQVGRCVPLDSAADSGGPDTGDTADTADTGDSTDTSSIDTADTADSADTADTADSGDTGPPPDPVVAFDVATFVPVGSEWYGLSVGLDGSVWAASSVGLLHLDPSTGATRLYGAADGLYTDSPTAVLVATDGTLWVGELGTIDRQGEHFQVEADGTLTLIELVNYQGAEEQAYAYRIREQPYGVGVGDIWMGLNEGLCLYDADLAVFEEHAHPDHPHGNTRGIAFTEEGDIWGGDQYWLARWRYSNDGDLSPSADLLEVWIPWPVEVMVPVEIIDLDARAGHVWLASTLYGIARVDVAADVGASVISLYTSPPTANAIRAFDDDTVFIGSETGLWVVDVPADTVADLSTTDPDLAGEVSQLARDDASGAMWLAMPGALVRVGAVP